MGRLLFLDTETTGLPKERNKNGLQEPNNWPDIVSVAWSVYEGTELKKTMYSIIKPDGWVIPEESTKIHTITTEYALEHGRPLKDVLEELKSDLASVHTFVAHNVQFDKNVLLSAYAWRLKTNPWAFWPVNDVCTMIRSEGELKLPSKFRDSMKYKSPTLKELYYDTFHEELVNAHSSKDDMEAVVEIYFERWRH